MITLYQFQFSHYCEKARWALDHKQTPYVCKNLFPGLHLKTTKKIAPKSCLPILDHNGTVIQDSTSIISFLEEAYPYRPLTPNDPQEAIEALAWEEYLDDEIGVPLRLWFYHHTLPDRARTMKFMLDRAPWYGRPLLTILFPNLRTAMIKSMNITATAAEKSEARLRKAFDKLDDALKEHRFLVGDSFSRADLTACALLSPFCAPDKSDEEILSSFPEKVCEFRDKHKTRPFFGWVIDTYKNHRHSGITGT